MKKKILSFIGDGQKVVFSLILAFLGLISIGFGGAVQGPLYYWLFGFLLLFLSVAVSSMKFEKEELRSLIIFSIPLVVFVCFGAINVFYVDSFAGFANGLLLAIGLLSVFALGLLLKNFRKCQIIHILLAIIIGFSISVVVSLITNLIVYGPFYVQLSKGAIYFFDGVDHVVSTETKFFIGTGIVEVSIRYGSIAASLLAVSGLSLLFISPKEHKITFSIIAAGAFIGVLFLILLPFFYAFVIMIPTIIIAIILRFFRPSLKASRNEKIVGVTLLSLIALFVLLLFINALAEPAFIKSNSFLKMIFENSITLPIMESISAVFHGSSSTGGLSIKNILFGAYSSGYTNYGGVTKSVLSIQNHSFEFVVLLEGGIIAFLGLCVLIVFAFISIRRWILKDEKLDAGKVGLALILLAIFTFNSLLNDVAPFVYNRVYQSPLRNSFSIILMMFILGLSCEPDFLKSKPLVKEAKPTQVEAVKEENV